MPAHWPAYLGSRQGHNRHTILLTYSDDAEHQDLTKLAEPECLRFYWARGWLQSDEHLFQHVNASVVLSEVNVLTWGVIQG